MVGFQNILRALGSNRRSSQLLNFSQRHSLLQHAVASKLRPANVFVKALVNTWFLRRAFGKLKPDKSPGLDMIIQDAIKHLLD